jgi:hypothetical protein
VQVYLLVFQAAPQPFIENAANPGKALLSSIDMNSPGHAWLDAIMNLNNGTGDRLTENPLAARAQPQKINP